MAITTNKKELDDKAPGAGSGEAETSAAIRI